MRRELHTTIVAGRVHADERTSVPWEDARTSNHASSEVCRSREVHKRSSSCFARLHQPASQACRSSKTLQPSADLVFATGAVADRRSTDPICRFAFSRQFSLMQQTAKNDFPLSTDGGNWRAIPAPRSCAEVPGFTALLPAGQLKQEHLVAGCGARAESNGQFCRKLRCRS